MSDWHRIEKVVKWTGLSVNAFSRAIGLNRSEIIYRIKRGSNGISRELADTICAKYPAVGKSWLLVGEGEMFVDENTFLKKEIPFYRADVLKFIDQQQWPEPAGYITPLFFKEADFAAVFRGNAMEPEIPGGAIVVFRRTEPHTITPGKSYLIVSPLFTGIRIVRKDLYSTQLRLVPRNTAEFDELLIERSDVKEIYAIPGILIIKE